ncbi:NUDIX hydrolase [Paremcibacter congregatus]|uniref:NUDIX hydrolase n=1 Tax=Paremcibacter congregatus TaxID=2043170 RepID=A0A2G4YVR3_9PROT|nr:NUDIX domain-containing protein [Paremcibacter congregatus]PHZ86421.1 NUDIX hydrolase [Paremcibacter congregatus]QDE28483.1 NUDIX hydrolase [Paremcibacter congregatus]
MTYSYDYPHPAVTTDIVIFTVQDNALCLLLIRRGEDPYKGKWALPGGFLRMDEDIEHCAARELAEEAGVQGVYLEQLATFGTIDRDPRERVISVAYYALIPSDDVALQAGTDAAEAQWFPLSDLPPLAFDHSDIVRMAQQRLSAKMSYSTIGLQFMPAAFTLSDLQRVYEIASGKTLDKRNFRKWVLSLDLVEETGHKQTQGAHRPAMLYRVKKPSRIDIIK